VVPSIGVFVATNYKPTLWRALDSIAAQGLQDNDKVLVMGDGNWSDWPGIEDAHWADRTRAYGLQFEWFDGPCTRNYGKTQQNLMLDMLEGKTDLVVCQEDDDIFQPKMFEVMRENLLKFPGKLFIYYVLQTNFQLYPTLPNWGGWFDGHIVVCPNVPGKVGRFGEFYAGDQDWVKSCGKLWDEETEWCNEIITVCRPKDGQSYPRSVLDVRWEHGIPKWEPK
jgi:hypothetical protein